MAGEFVPDDAGLLSFLLPGLLLITFLVAAMLGLAEYYAYEFSPPCLGRLEVRIPSILQDLKTRQVRFDTPEGHNILALALKQSGDEYCQVEKEAVRFFRAGEKNFQGSPLLLVCGRGGHGWWRKFSWGIVLEGSVLKTVKIPADYF